MRDVIEVGLLLVASCAFARMIWGAVAGHTQYIEDRDRK